MTSSPDITWADVEAVKGAPLEQSCIQWGLPGRLGELCPELFPNDMRPGCTGDWNNHTAKWDAQCQTCKAWMLNQQKSRVANIGDKIFYRSPVTGRARSGIVVDDISESPNKQQLLIQGNGWEDIVDPSCCKVEAAPYFQSPPPSIEWCDWAREKWWYSEHHSAPGKDPRFFVLRDKILKIGGDNVLMNGDNDDLRLLERGTWFPGNIGRLNKGRPNRCHSNSCLYYRAHPEARICTGYALSPDDGLWRSHSWCLVIKDSGERVIIETTVKRLVYFGYVMTNDEAEKFCEQEI